MTDDQWLREGLRDAVPEPPPAPDRAADARGLARRNRRRTTLAAAVGAAVVVAGLAVAPTLLGDGDGNGRTPGPTKDSAAGFACPAPTAVAKGRDSVPAGAVAVRLCQGPGMGFDPPADALVTDVEQVVETINEQPERPEPGACTMELGAGYLLAFQYADGTVVPVSGEMYGCRTLTVGSSERRHPEKPYAQFLRLLRAQRGATTPPEQAAPRPGCHDQNTSPLARPADMVTATLCVWHPTADGDYDPVPVAVPDHDLATLLTDRVRRPGPPSYDLENPDLRLVGDTAWGDRTIAWLAGESYLPGPDAQAILDRLVAEAEAPTPTLDRRSTPGEVVAAYVDLLNAGDTEAAAALWKGDGAQPTVSARIEYKEIAVTFPDKPTALLTAFWRELPEDGTQTEPREVEFRLLQGPGPGPWRIIGFRDQEVDGAGR